MKIEKEKIQTMLKRHKSFEIISEISRAFNAEDYDRVMALAQKILFNEKEITLENREAWYFKAVVLDIRGSKIESLEIFRNLLLCYPNQPNFINSYNVVCRSVATEAHEIFDKNPDDEILLKYFDLLKDIWRIPLFLYEAWARNQVKIGNVKEARDKLTLLLELCPGDFDYLKANLQISNMANCKDWIEEAEERVIKLIEDQPHRFELYQLLPKSEVQNVSGL